jgi:predicted O-methyltransferase YrrM
MSNLHLSLNDDVHAYLLANEPPEHEVLYKLRAHTQTLKNAQFQISPEQGHFLVFLTRLIGARRMLEVGTFTGYGTLALALALPADGKILTCDLHDETVTIGRRYWEKAGVADKIKTTFGPALRTMAKLQESEPAQFDLIFIDADKTEYDQYYELALTLVRAGGLIVLDNMLRHGDVANPDSHDPRTVSVRRLNAKIASDERVDRVLLPIADGMTLVRRR